jgi:predicted glycogen debranching enzyme
VSWSGERLCDTSLEWLEADGLGGFASGTIGGLRTRRYHGLLCVAQRPPTRRVMLVNALEVWVDLGQGPRALSSHRYLPGVTYPDGIGRLRAFEHEPLPRWTYELEPDALLEHELFVPRDSCSVVLCWRLSGGPRPGARLTVRPLLSVRDLHALVREDAGFRMQAASDGRALRWQPRPGFPGIVALASGRYQHEPLWYRDFLHEEERARGYDHVEDLASPGYFQFDLGDGDAGLILGAEAAGLPSLRLPSDVPVGATVHELREREVAQRRALGSLGRAAEAYLVRRGPGHSLVAGYPWFTDWGRDTFIAMRGLLLARGRLAQAGSILLSWADHVSRGMLPNRFPDDADQPEFNSVDASLWFCQVVQEFLELARDLPRAERAVLENAVLAILEGHAAGTRYGIRADADGLLACGEPGWQLTWMDAKVAGEVITPRIGKPVEIQALWLRALAFGARFEQRFRTLHGEARAAFEGRFWNEERGALFDVVDVDHVRGTADASLRPNQLLALGGLGESLLAPQRSARALELIERELLTPLGLRTLPRSDPRYAPRYAGGPLERDRAYHQGTVWPWLLGPFVEAWVRARGSSAEAKRAARERFLPPLHAHLREAGLGHVSEIADAEPPHTPRGCPFQAWSLGELLRLELGVLAADAPREARPALRARGKR